jgi:putative phage-type endonuclease
MRKQHLGASDAPVVMGVSPWKTPLQLWEEKLGLRKEPGDNTAMKYGRSMEEPARQAYERHTNILVTPEVIFHPTKKFMMASLDGLSMDRDVIVEIKNPNEDDHNLAKKGKIPEKYYPQLQHQLDCLPGAVLHYFSFRDGKGALVEVARDDNYIRTLVETEEGFWKRVVDFEAPELLAKDYRELVNDQEWMEIRQERRDLVDLQKALDKRDEENRRRALTKAAGQSTRGAGLKFTRILERGRVDYKAIPQLESVDLNLYRKTPIEKWRFDFYSDEKK